MWSYRLPKFEAIRGVTLERLSLLEFSLSKKNGVLEKTSYQRYCELNQAQIRCY